MYITELQAAKMKLFAFEILHLVLKTTNILSAGPNKNADRPLSFASPAVPQLIPISMNHPQDHRNDLENAGAPIAMCSQLDTACMPATVVRVKNANNGASPIAWRNTVKR